MESQELLNWEVGSKSQNKMLSFFFFKDVILIKPWPATTCFKDPTISLSSPSEQYGLCNLIISKSKMQNKPGREPEIELSHWRYDMSSNEPLYLSHPTFMQYKRI